MIYEPIRQEDGTFVLSPEDMSVLKEKYSNTTIYSALLKLYEAAPKADQFQVSGDMAPCSDCGGIDFIRTGNCHACTTCGASQGCS